MASINNPVNVDEDEDEFDWEAAVREIDVACETSNVSTSSSNHQRNSKKPLATKQSKLDKFFTNAPPRPQPQPQRQSPPSPTPGFELEEESCYVQIDTEAAKTWIYPINVPVRDYQFNITKTALFSNTLVALPTGLGKTLIAAVVMYNYFRWFPEGKVVFAAPSRPLVMQQIEACHNIVGIPQEWTIDMTGQVTPAKRESLWKTKRVFFVTPQVLEKDIQSGTCLLKYLVCLVIDEAHRAMGNYSYCTAVRELMAVPVQLRILALTATPGSKQQTIQLVIDNLHISTLEYRNENDHDVSPYIHNREIELIEVPVGQTASEISYLLMDIIRPYVSKLSAYGLIQQRDCSTLSPIDLLNSREKYRQAPPPALPHIKFGEVEAYFGALITLYHIRRLLSSHGIRPAYEMLDEKLQQGPFARFMSKNEIIRKVKLHMQQHLSHGAPSPKLSKMLEVLADHFKAKDPKNSRVIIFSNFRGSVRDIMSALTSLGNFVKATEFVGQSSGKTLKGQTQKVQQAVLEKFRAGGYNVIVATSIGEEGLDIMEVDLVICFDANVSPLRMIQRMGRTGRKHDGRVVVLACEGSELKGYLRKQASSKAIKKHMRNGGMNSFNFHPSPRMVPHVIKPEVQLVELSIEEFVSRGKKVKGDQAITDSPIFKKNLTVTESESIAKYFHPSSKKAKLSLIAFPHFQAFPSGVHKVMHSFRTGMLIDTMQHLQGITFRDYKNSFAETQEEGFSSKCLEVQTDEYEEDKKDALTLDNLQGSMSPQNCDDHEQTHVGSLGTQEAEQSVPRFQEKNSAAHSYHFGSDFVSVDALGNVLILSLPPFPYKESDSKCISTTDILLLNTMKPDAFHLRASDGNHSKHTVRAKAVEEVTTSQRISMVNSRDSVEEDMLGDNEKILQTPISKTNQLNGDTFNDEIDVVDIEEPSQIADECIGDLADLDLSPRLTSLIKSGIVPESPINECGFRPLHDDKGTETPARKALTEYHSPGKMKNTDEEIDPAGINGSVSPSNNETQTPLLKMKRPRGHTILSPAIQGPEANITDYKISCSTRDMHFSPTENSENTQPVRKFKRLRKAVDHRRNKNPSSINRSTVVAGAKPATSFPSTTSIQNKPGKGKEKLRKDARAFIEDEAEVSSEDEVSDDEDDLDNNSHDDSFIDDRVNPTFSSTQTAAAGVDMMAIYRRSLLSQSPVVRQPNISADYTPDSAALMTRTTEDGSGSSSVKSKHSTQIPTIKSEDQSASKIPSSFQINQERITMESNPCTTTGPVRENESNTETQKRKFKIYQSRCMPCINLEQQFSFQSEPAGMDSSQQDQPNKIDIVGNELDDDDDEFYERLDFDAVEEHAALLLKQREELRTQKQDTITGLKLQSPSIPESPSFDLGI